MLPLLKRSTLSIILLGFLLLDAEAQETDTVMTITKDTDTTIRVNDKENKACNGKTRVSADKMPRFPGGKEKRERFIQDTLEYPDDVKEKGTVLIGFTVCKDGSLKDFKVLQGIGEECDEAALRALRAMPNWKPGERNDRKVIVRKQIPVRFKP